MEDLDEGSPLLDQNEAELLALESRLQKHRRPEKSANSQYAKGLALVASLGFVLAGCLFAGVSLGDYAALRTGQSGFKALGVVLGLVVALLAGAKLMAPLMKSED